MVAILRDLCKIIVMNDPGQRFDLALRDIVPEYSSQNPAVRWLFDQRIRIAASYASAATPRRLLDAGCGDGSFLARLGPPGEREFWGIDLNPSIAGLASQLPGCRFAVSSLTATGFTDDYFDAVVSLDVLEHIKELGTAIAEVRRVLRPGGILITSEPTESALYKSLRFIQKGTYSQESGPGAGIHYYNARQIDALVRRAGFVRMHRRMVPLPFPCDLFHLNQYIKI